jgi:hypothetical protein
MACLCLRKKADLRRSVSLILDFDAGKLGYVFPRLDGVIHLAERFDDKMFRRHGSFLSLQVS